MIGKISGRLDWKGRDTVLIDCRGVGYILHVSDRTLAAMPALGEAVALYTDLLVREDLLQLFGFPTMLEKEWHKLLMSVQGVGAKASMAMLGALGAEGVARAITLGDARAVQSAPGVGPKLAQRVILELKSKAPSLMASGASFAGDAGGEGLVEALAEADAEAQVMKEPKKPAKTKGPSPAEIRAMQSADVLSALANLGYGPGDAAEAVAHVSGENPEADTSALIRLALKRLAPR